MMKAQNDKGYIQKLPVPLLIGGLLVVFIGTLAALTPRPIPAKEGQAAAIESIDYFKNISIEGKAAVVIDISTGRVLYEKNADVQLPLASLTKVALVLAASEVLRSDQAITIPYYIGSSDGRENLAPGERWTVQDIVDFTLVTSSNTGAVLLSQLADPTMRSFYPEAPKEATLWRMNGLAKELGLSETFFLNVSGLDISTTQAGAFGSARDVAKLFAYAASADPSLFAGTAHEGMLLSSGSASAKAENTNEAQGAIPGLIMGKTGFTDLAGGNLAVVFDVGLSRPIVAVVLGSSEDGRFSDMHVLVEKARETVLKEE